MIKFYKIKLILVGLGRLELPTSRLSGVRSNQLSYRPNTPISQNINERDTKTAIPAFYIIAVSYTHLTLPTIYSV